jgi:hypothetical protein
VDAGQYIGEAIYPALVPGYSEDVGCIGLGLGAAVNSVNAEDLVAVTGGTPLQVINAVAAVGI